MTVTEVTGPTVWPTRPRVSRHLPHPLPTFLSESVSLCDLSLDITVVKMVMTTQLGMGGGGFVGDYVFWLIYQQYKKYATVKIYR